MSGFRKFLLRGNVIDLAVAVVIGAAFGAVVQAFVKDIVTPFIGMFGGIPDFSAWTVTVNNSRFLIGDFVNALLTFVVIALIIYYFVVVPVNRLTPPPAPAATAECPECLSKVPPAARRCSFCTAPLAPSA